LCRLRAGCVTALAENEIHELARHDDRLLDLGAVQVRLHLRRRLRARDELVLRQARLDLEAVAHAAVHLHDEHERVALELRLLGAPPPPAPRAATSETSRYSRRTKRDMPSMPSSVHSMSSFAGPMKRMYSRTGSAP